MFKQEGAVMKQKNDFFCIHCRDTGLLQDQQSTSICPFCIDSQQFMNAINIAINQCKKRGDKKMEADLIAVCELLPQYPVMAYLEAESRTMKPDFLAMLRTTFSVRPLA